MTITIINNGSGAEKVCTFVDFAAKGAWVELRYPGAAGLWAFSLVHGGMECKRHEHPPWRLGIEDLERLRGIAKDAGIKFSRPRIVRATPRKPQAQTNQRQIELFK